MPKSDKLNFQYGMEITWHDAEAWSGPGYQKEHYYKQITQQMQRRFRKYKYRPGNTQLYDEVDSTAEFKSPRLQSIKEIEEYYKYCAAITKKNKWPVSPRNWISGGGHLHVFNGGSGFDREFESYVVKDVCNRPYLAWIFAEPEQDDHKCPVLNFHNVRGTIEWRHVVGHHCTVGCSPYSGIELRFFEAPKNWREQELHVLFADRWLSHLMKQYKAGKKVTVVKRTMEQLQKLSYKWCVAEFNALLKEIGLDPKDYKHFIRRNLKVRCDNGWVKN